MRKHYRLYDVINIIGGGTPKTTNPEYWGGEVPWLSVSDFNTGKKYVYSAEKSITKKGLVNSSTKILRRGQLIISARGTVGVVAMIGKNMAFNQSCYGIDAKQEYTTNDFLYYLLKSHISDIQMGSHGAVFNTITRDSFKQIMIDLPDIHEQKAIASILSSLDDKIDLLHRQNQTLEALAETIFRQWFLMDIKKKWKADSLNSIATFLNGLACQKYPPNNYADSLPVIKIKELRQGFSESSDRATSKIDSKYIVDNGDVLFSWSGSLEVVLWSYGKGVLNQHLFKVTSEKYPKWFYYLWLKVHLSEFREIATDKATTMGHIQRKHLSEAQVLIPDDESLLALNQIFEPMLKKYIMNNNQIRTLESLRDTLLPKLMSGEVRVKYNEDEVEKVV
ncbi:MAG: restriction endonuclease subunit S [Bacillota bacterium]|nr:restriction endonuclease subunit S [Bacillota bacterium]